MSFPEGSYLSIGYDSEAGVFNLFEVRRMSHARVANEINKSSPWSREGALERLFSMVFSGMVYPQIWEDPVVDMDALSIRPTDHIVTIASGGCNVASYLTAKPAKITAIDLNDSHVALNKLKLAALATLPDYRSFKLFFGNGADVRNVEAYRTYIAGVLDEETRHYWERKSIFQQPRISMFASGFYRHGVLGRFIAAVHLMARLHGCDLKKLVLAGNRDEQRAIFDQTIAPLFDKWLIRWLAGQPASLYGLGIPPAQYKALGGDHRDGMIGALRERAEKLACRFDIKDNYFAWQAFGRGYSQAPDAPLPPYLEELHYRVIKALTGRVDVLHDSFTGYLARSSSSSVDCFVLLDAQDWMDDATLNALWTEITRTACPGARVIFRTAADEMLLPGRVSASVLGRWRRNDARSAQLHELDRSSIYGRFHLYELSSAGQ